MNNRILLVLITILVVISSTVTVKGWGIVTPPETNPIIIYEKNFTFWIQNYVPECNGYMCDVEAIVRILEPTEMVLPNEIVPKYGNKKINIIFDELPINRDFNLTFIVGIKRIELKPKGSISFRKEIQKTVLLRYIPTSVIAPERETPEVYEEPSHIPPVNYSKINETEQNITPSIEEVNTTPEQMTEKEIENLEDRRTSNWTYESSKGITTVENPINYFAIGGIVLALTIVGMLGYLKVFRGYFIIPLAIILLLSIQPSVYASESHSVALTVNIPPRADFISPTPASGGSIGNYLEVNVSLNETPNSCVLTVNNLNYTMTLYSYFCFRNHTLTVSGLYYYNVTVEDLNNTYNVTETRNVTSTIPVLPIRRYMMLSLIILIIALGSGLFFIDTIFSGGSPPREVLIKFIYAIIFIIVVATGLGIILPVVWI